MRLHQGKTFLSPPKLFKAETALYFPNMMGYTLASPSSLASTTSVLEGKTSIVSVFSSVWAERQTQSFVGKAQNPELARELERLRGRGLQSVSINIEEDWLKAGLVRFFLPWEKRRVEQAQWGRNFVVRRGIGEEVRQSIGLANGKVGYVYLVDGACKIRWAGSGNADLGEAEGLVGSVKRLVERPGKASIEMEK